MPTRMVFLDTESFIEQKKGEKHLKMKLGWCCYAERKKDQGYVKKSWSFFDNTKNLNEYIEGKTQQKQVLWVFGHNIYFDLQSSDFYYYFTRWGWVLDFTYTEGITFILVIKKNKKVLKLISTTNYFSYSLAVMGKIIGRKKLDIDFEKCSDDELKIYCKRDVEILVEFMEKFFEFLENNDLGSFCLTKASQAMMAFRHRFMKHQIGVHEAQEVIELERNSYLGGRVEAFKIGKVFGWPFISLDINSMYPYVMKNNFVPTKLIGFREDITIEKLRELVTVFCVTAEVFVQTNKPIYGIKRNGKLIFPTGRFKAYLNTGGVIEALKRSHIIKIMKVAIYERAKIFADYVDFFYSSRYKYKKEGNQVFETLSKYMLNSLYGKFGQKKPITTEKEDITFDGYYRKEVFDLKTKEMEIETKLFNKKIIVFGKENSKSSFVSVAAHITEYARLLLYKIMEEVGLNRILYVDTDSIKIRKKYLGKVKHKIDNSELGALKVEYEFNKFSIRSCKDYIIDKKKVLKGVPKQAKELDPETFLYDQFCGQATHLRREVDRYFIVKEIKKKIKIKYNKGIVSWTGKVKPFMIYEEIT